MDVETMGKVAIKKCRDMKERRLREMKEKGQKIELLLISESLPDKFDNYFYNVGATGRDKRERSFFRGIMQGVRLLALGVKKYDEIERLEQFIAGGYFLIDTYNGSLKGKPSEKVKLMTKDETINKLMAEIYSIAPEKILFICKTNEKVMERLIEKDPNIASKFALDMPLPYPGNGWLTRKDGRGFCDKFPRKYRYPDIKRGDAL